MMTTSEKAKQLFESGHNCAQAVLCAFCEQTGIDEKTAYMLSSSFGGGIGRMREVCGAVSGMAMVAGLLYGYTLDEEHAKKAEHYALIQSLANKFKEENGSIICRELLDVKPDTHVPEKRTAQYYKKRPCSELVFCAAKIMQDYIDEHNSK